MYYKVDEKEKSFGAVHVVWAERHRVLEAGGAVHEEQAAWEYRGEHGHQRTHQVRVFGVH